MSTANIIAILVFSECLIIAIALKIILARRQAHKKPTPNISRRSKQPAHKTESRNDYQAYLKKHIGDTKDRIVDIPPQQGETLNVRLSYLNLESKALQFRIGSEDYWNCLNQGIHETLEWANEKFGSHSADHSADHSTVTAEPPAQQQTNNGLAELDDLDAVNVDDSDIPTLHNEVTPATPGPMAQISKQANDEIKRLRNIITRQLSAIEFVKNTLQDSIDTAQQDSPVVKNIEELEVAHAQFNLGLNTLDKLFNQASTLNETTTDSEHTPDPNALVQQLAEANATLESQQHELNDKQTLIAQLETKTHALQSEIETLRQNQSENNTEGLLAQGSHNADQLRNEMQSLTESLSKKNQQLDQLLEENDLSTPAENSENGPVGLLADASLDIETLIMENQNHSRSGNATASQPEPQANPDTVSPASAESSQSTSADFDVDDLPLEESSGSLNSQDIEQTKHPVFDSDHSSVENDEEPLNPNISDDDLIPEFDRGNSELQSNDEPQIPDINDDDLIPKFDVNDRAIDTDEEEEPPIPDINDDDLIPDFDINDAVEESNTEVQIPDINDNDLIPDFDVDDRAVDTEEEPLIPDINDNDLIPDFDVDDRAVDTEEEPLIPDINDNDLIPDFDVDNRAVDTEEEPLIPDINDDDLISNLSDDALHTFDDPKQAAENDAEYPAKPKHAG